jgi:two-component system sensor histidine kinase PilS (NtrC family)
MPSEPAGSAIIAGPWQTLLALWRKSEPPEFQWGLLGYFNVARLIVAVILVLYAALPSQLDQALGTPVRNDLALWLLLSYLAMALLILGSNLVWRRHFHFRVHFYLALDLVMLGALLLSFDRSGSGIAMVLLMPVMAAGALCGLLPALMAAALASLIVLAEPLGRSFLLLQVDAGLLTAGLYGVAYMTAASLMYVLGHRQLLQEQLVQAREHELRLQQLISRLMVHDMRDGVVLVRTSGRVVAANPAALTLLGIGTLPPLGDTVAREGGLTLFDLHALPRLRPVFDAMRQWLPQKDDGARIIDLLPVTGRDALGVQRAPLPTRLRLRFVEPGLANLRSVYQSQFTRPLGTLTYPTLSSLDGHPSSEIAAGEGWSAEDEQLLREELRHTVLIHIESWQRVAEQAQQEKLASMGRLVAGVAHQIRNPLSAISHASELLSESAPAPTLPGAEAQPVDPQMNARLLRIIHDNVRRLDQVVSDILMLSRRSGQSQGARISVDLRRVLPDIVERWRHAASGYDETQGPVNANLLRVEVDVHAPVRFDPEQLQQVVSNLLDNALRYCSGNPGAIRIMAQALDAANAELIIWNDGPEVAEAEQVRLFEPFYTSDARGTGLGLFIVRELCSVNDAQVRYGAVSVEALLDRTGTWLGTEIDSLPARAFVITLAIDHASERAG